jgi:hypothetical protein
MDGIKLLFYSLSSTASLVVYHSLLKHTILFNDVMLEFLSLVSIALCLEITSGFLHLLSLH